MRTPHTQISLKACAHFGKEAAEFGKWEDTDYNIYIFIYSRHIADCQPTIHDLLGEPENLHKLYTPNRFHCVFIFTSLDVQPYLGRNQNFDGQFDNSMNLLLIPLFGNLLSPSTPHHAKKKFLFKIL